MNPRNDFRVRRSSAAIFLSFVIVLTAKAESQKQDVSDILKAIGNQLQPFTVSQHNLAEMRDGFFGRKTIDNQESTCVDNILTTTMAFRNELKPLYVGELVAKMRLPEDAEIVRQAFYITVRNAVDMADTDIRYVDGSISAMHDPAARAQAARVRAAMAAIREILNVASKNEKNLTPG